MSKKNGGFKGKGFDAGDNFKVRDLELAPAGRRRIEWAESRMPVLMWLREKHRELKSLKGMRIAGCIHVTKETAVLVETLLNLEEAALNRAEPAANEASHPYIKPHQFV